MKWACALSLLPSRKKSHHLTFSKWLGVWRQLLWTFSPIVSSQQGREVSCLPLIKVPKFQVFRVNMVYTFRSCKYFKQQQFGNSYTHKMHLYFRRKNWLEYLGTLLKQKKRKIKVFEITRWNCTFLLSYH